MDAREVTDVQQRLVDYEATVYKNRTISFALGITALVLLIFGGMSLHGTLPSVLDGAPIYYATAILSALYLAHKFYVMISEHVGPETMKALFSMVSSIVLLALGILAAAHVGNANYTLGIVIMSSISWAAWLYALLI